MPQKSVVIAGAGAGGLSLLRQMKASALEPLHITVIESDPSSIELRNWCQWVPVDGLSDYHTSAWSSIKTRTPQGTYISKATQWIYARTTGGAYRTEVERLPSHHRVDWVQAHVSSIGYDQASDMAMVTSDAGDFKADFAFTSVHREQAGSPLWQHFHGWEVEVDRDVFDPGCATLMDFDVEQVADGVVFMYVLPHNARRALVECTAFSPAAWDVALYERHLQAYLEKEFGLMEGGYTRAFVETGRIPMRLDAPMGAINPKTWPIGSLANTIKPSTGYAFTRIQDACRHMVHTWERTGRPALPEQSAGRFGWYDKLMLDIIDREPELMVPVFDRLFKGNTIDEVFTFLDEKSTLAQDARMFMKLPKKPFLKAVWRTATS
jgi:lycopene beta-cyclase